MKISREKRLPGQATPATQAAQTSKSAGSGAKQTSGAKDEKVEAAQPGVGVSLSDTTQAIASAKTAIAAMPDVRVDKVDEIKLSVDEGSYQVESRTVAERMVNESLRESAHLKQEDNS